MVVAESESVTTVLTGTTSYLLRDSIQLRALVHEICSNSQRDKDITRLSLSRLFYLDAVLHEGLRLCPTIPGGRK